MNVTASTLHLYMHNHHHLFWIRLSANFSVTVFRFRPPVPLNKLPKSTSCAEVRGGRVSRGDRMCAVLVCAYLFIAKADDDDSEVDVDDFDADDDDHEMPLASTSPRNAVKFPFT